MLLSRRNIVSACKPHLSQPLPPHATIHLPRFYCHRAAARTQKVLGYLDKAVDTSQLRGHVRRSLHRRYPPGALPPYTHLEYIWPSGSPVPAVQDRYGHFLAWFDTHLYRDSEQGKIHSPSSPGCLAVDNGNDVVVVAYPALHRIACHGITGELHFGFDAHPDPRLQFWPVGLAVHPNYCSRGPRWLVLNAALHEVLVFKVNGKVEQSLRLHIEPRLLSRGLGFRSLFTFWQTVWPRPAPASLPCPKNLEVDPQSGEIIVTSEVDGTQLATSLEPSPPPLFSTSPSATSSGQ